MKIREYFPVVVPMKYTLGAIFLQFIRLFIKAEGEGSELVSNALYI